MMCHLSITPQKKMRNTHELPTLFLLPMLTWDIFTHASLRVNCTPAGLRTLGTFIFSIVLFSEHQVNFIQPVQ